jgi:uncharacterized glyoxalase superfamily protein PhnB
MQWVVTDDTGAFLDFVTAAFGGQELARVAVEEGSIGHGEIRVGNTGVVAVGTRRRLGGVTGDVLGAAVELVVLACLVVSVAGTRAAVRSASARVWIGPASM